MNASTQARCSKISVALVSLFVLSLALHAHGPEDHAHAEEGAADSAGQDFAIESVAPPLAAFPTLHPLVVHFPIVLLLLAAIIYPIALFLRNRTLLYTSIAVAAAGLAGGVLAAYFVHPHTTGLTPEARGALANHDRFAYATIYAAAAAVSLQLFGLILRRRWLEFVAAGTLVASAVLVLVAGHFGAELTHLHGVGPRGEFLELKKH